MAFILIILFTIYQQLVNEIIQYHFQIDYIGGSDPRILVYNPDDLTYNGIIYVVDCSDKDRIICAISELQKLLSIEKLKDLPILLLANKKDLVQVNLQEIACEFKLEKLSKNWHIQPCHAITGEGIQDGLKWMQQYSKILIILCLFN